MTCRNVVCSATCLLAILAACRPGAGAAEPCTSGLQPGQRPGPYAALIATGPERGQSFCYVCETGDRPAVVIFARGLSDPLAKLLGQLDKTVADKDGLRAWATFLSDDQPALDPKLVKWARQHAINRVPLGVFEDVAGPPSYRLSKEAEVTVIMFAKRKVVANFAFRAGELDDAGIAEVMKTVPRLLDKK